MRAKLLLIGTACTLMAACSGMTGATGQGGDAPTGSTAQTGTSGSSGRDGAYSGSSYPASDGVHGGWTSHQEGYGVGRGSPAGIANNQMDWGE